MTEPVRRRTLGLASVGTGLAWLAIMLLRLFAGGAVGMGDQGDGLRVMCQLGVRTTAPFNAVQSSVVYPTWVKHTWYGDACSTNGSGTPYRSSELWLLSLAKHLTPILGLPGALDLRALGVVCAVFAAAIVAAIVLAMPGPLALRIGMASAVGLLIADSAVSEFFISPFSEPAELLATFALFPGLLFLWRRGHTTWPGLAAVAFCGMIALGAKTQAVALLPGLLLAVLWLPHTLAATDDPRPRRAMRVLRWFTRRLPGLLVAVALLGGTAYGTLAGLSGSTGQDVYAEVFEQILPHSSDPAATLKELGADPALVYAIGTNPESANAADLRLDYLAFRKNVTEVKIVEYYLRHPTTFWSTGSDGLQGVAHWKQDYLGSYLVGSGHPAGAIEDRVDVYGTIFQHRSKLFFVVFWIFTLYVGVRTSRRRGLSSEGRALGRLTVFAAISSFCSFWAVMISVGFPDMYRHMILTNVLLALGLPLIIACILVRIQLRRKEEAAVQLAAKGPAASAATAGEPAEAPVAR
jgi:hypothetical protein